jgi:hypothetical protein
MKKASNGFETGDIVTVINKRDIMYKFQGEVKSTYVDDEDTNEIMVVVKFHVKVVGDRPDLRRVGDYYESEFWGHLEFKGLRSELKSKILLNDKSFTGNSLLQEIEGLYSDREYRLMGLDPYQRFDKNYIISNIIIHFKR